MTARTHLTRLLAAATACLVLTACGKKSPADSSAPGTPAPTTLPDANLVIRHAHAGA